MNFYFGKAIAHDGGDYGVAILSKYPLSTYKLPKNDDPKAEQRVLALATITLINGQKIRFASTHLDAQKNDANRLMRVTDINRLTVNEKLPLIVSGDLNADPTSEVIKIFDSQFIRSCTECTFTIPVINPQKTIDHIGFKKRDRFKVLSHKVIAARNASDHLPILTVLRLNP
jgi:endonuclease/exonuclease/phosphatase family metal-dependent hydrolase